MALDDDSYLTVGSTMSKFKIHIIIVTAFVGLLSGACSSVFLYSLEWVTKAREEHTIFILGLPLFGFLFGRLLKLIPHHINQGVPYILNELDNHDAHVSPWMTPFIFLSSLGTHLFGGSAGREGVGVIMGASVAHLIPRKKISYQDLRPYLIYSGIAAGFSSIFGTPFAAIIFSFELHHFKDVRKGFLFLTTILSSLIALLTSSFLGPSHQHYTVGFHFEINTIIHVSIATFTSGIGGLAFYWGLKGYTRLISKLFSQIEWKLAFGAAFVSVIVYIFHGYEYVGIGNDIILKSFNQQMEPYDFVMKCLLTVMTLSIGFKGGEVTPLFFMGATLSNSIASFFSYNNYALSSSLGMVGLFGAVTATPIASMVMATELFGWKVGGLSVLTCYFARLIMGKRSVYRH